MAPPSAQTLQRLAAETGYQLDTIEKVLRLLDVLVEINRDPFLKGRLALKGGTALNVFHLDLDRLSVDIDLNYIGGLDRAVMESERQDVDAAIARIFTSQSYNIHRRPKEHAGGKWSTRYNSALGGNATLEVDINYMARQPLFGATRMESRNLGGLQASGILVLDIHEIVAGKIVALIDRRTARDLFDARRILSIERLDWVKIKTAVLAIGACCRTDWRGASANSIERPAESPQKLLNCLPRGHIPENKKDIDVWFKETIELCQERYAFLFNLSANERAFLDGILDHGEINANLLNADDETQARISTMPMLAWKTLNVRKHSVKTRHVPIESATLTDPDKASPQDE